MSITDELRQVAAKTEEANGRCGKLYRGDLDRIADRIDAEHADMREFCDRLREAAESREDVTLFGVDYVALPLDADGVPIHIGDVVETPRGDVFTVTGIMCELGKWTVNGWIPARLRHHEPTVEDVLREFSCVLMGKQEFDGDVTEAIAEYAAKLRLAEREDS